MDLVLPTAFSLLVAIAGWYYLFYSTAAHRLAMIENQAINRQRVVLRRIGGLVMLLLAASFFAGFRAFDADRPGPGFVIIWLLVIVLLGMIVILALLDVRLTLRLRRQHDRKEPR